MRVLTLLALLALSAPVAAQQDTARVRVLSDSLRTELVRARGFIRGAETQLSKTLLIADRLQALLLSQSPPPIGTPIDTTTLPPVATQPPRVRIFDGDGQSAPADSVLPRVLEVAVTDSAGLPVVGHPVWWRPSAGRAFGQWGPPYGADSTGIMSSTTSTGRASVRWRLGAAIGEQTLTADAGTAGSVTFRANAVAISVPPPQGSILTALGPVGTMTPSWDSLIWMGVRYMDPGEELMACAYEQDGAGVFIARSHADCPNPPGAALSVGLG